jgi:hypothetical protein
VAQSVELPRTRRRIPKRDHTEKPKRLVSATSQTMFGPRSDVDGIAAFEPGLFPSVPELHSPL